jgi:hypothetical protein
MLEMPLHSREVKRGLVALLGALCLVSCASGPAQPSLVGDPDVHGESAIPWNRPQAWEGSAGLPAGMPGGAGNPNPNNPTSY